MVRIPVSASLPLFVVSSDCYEACAVARKINCKSQGGSCEEVGNSRKAGAATEGRSSDEASIQKWNEESSHLNTSPRGLCVSQDFKWMKRLSRKKMV